MTDAMKIIFNDIREEKREEYRLDALMDEACERDEECCCYDEDYDEEDYDEDSEEECE